MPTTASGERRQNAGGRYRSVRRKLATHLGPDAAGLVAALVVDSELWRAQEAVSATKLASCRQSAQRKLESHFQAEHFCDEDCLLIERTLRLLDAPGKREALLQGASRNILGARDLVLALSEALVPHTRKKKVRDQLRFALRDVDEALFCTSAEAMKKAVGRGRRLFARRLSQRALFDGIREVDASPELDGPARIRRRWVLGKLRAVAIEEQVVRVKWIRAQLEKGTTA